MAHGPDDAVEARPTVLVVDDDPAARTDLAAVLAPHADVVLAADGLEALRRLERTVPDVVVSGTAMPRLGGAGLVRTVRADERLAGVPVVVLAGTEAEAAEVLAAGATVCLTRPFAARELVAAVASTAELARVRRDRDAYEHLLDGFPALIWRADTEGRCDWFNTTWLEFTGRSRADELGDGWVEGVHPDDVARVLSTYRAAVAAREPFELEYRLRHRSGRHRWIVDIGRPVLDAAGDVVGYVGSCLDLSQRREAEAMLRTAAATEQAVARERQVAVELQRSLLPTLSADPEDLDLAVCYRSGAPDTQVGGDWYDVIELGAGRTALVIGDVMGRGVRAAAVMGQLRAAVRAYARLDLPPADVLTLLDGVVHDLDGDHIVTCVYAVYDPGDGSLTIANAGHPPPLLVLPGGRVRTLSNAAWPPLGTQVAAPREERVAVPPGALVVLYTDGLVEQRGRDVEDGVADLRALLAEVDTAMGARDLARLPDEIVRTMRVADHEDDDIAILVSRVPQRAHGAQHLWRRFVVRPDGQEVAYARRFVAETLDGWNLPEEVTDAAVLAVSELVTNAMVHGRPPVELRLRRTDRHVLVEVRDATTVMPRRMTVDLDSEHGRGLVLVDAVSDRWGARATDAGKAVWCSVPVLVGRAG